MNELEQLHEIILRERTAARDLDIDGLQVLLEEKKGLIEKLRQWQSLESGDREIAESIVRENRRNAHLFHFALNWTRENMEILQGVVSCPVYGHGGAMVKQCNQGNLLSGKI